MSRRILIVEDAPKTAHDLQVALQAEGFDDVAWLSNRRAATRYLRTHAVAFALLAEPLNGEMAEPLAELLCSNNTPFVVMTDTSNGPARWLRNHPIVKKPIDAQSVAFSIRRLCQVHELLDDLLGRAAGRRAVPHTGRATPGDGRQIAKG